MKSPPTPPLDRSIALLACLVYFVQGTLGLAGIALPLFLRGKGWSISEIATFAFLVGLPWSLKLLYGALSDGIPIRGLRRKPYVILASVLSVVSWAAFAWLPHEKGFLYLFAVTANIGFALTDVVTDALMVENSTDSNAQVYQSLAWGFRSFGAVLGGVSGGWLAGHLPYRWIFAVTAALPIMTLAGGLWIHETPEKRGEERLQFLKPLLQSLGLLLRGDLKWFSFLLIASSLSASFSTPFFFFLKEGLNFSETFLGSLASLTWLGAILGCFVYGRLLRNLSVKRMLRWAIGLNFINVLTTYLVTNWWSAVALSFLGGILGYLSLLPFLTAAAVLSRREGIEGSLFALLMSVNNLAQLVWTFIGGKFFDIIGLAPLVFLSAVIGLSGLFFVARLKTVGG